jgi:hypothetical protein
MDNRHLSVSPEKQASLPYQNEAGEEAERVASPNGRSWDAVEEQRVHCGTVKRRCTCRAYPFPHRRGGGLCKGGAEPDQVWQGKGGKNPHTWQRACLSSIRSRLLRHYELHPIHDRKLIRRFLPKLYVGYCKRGGYPYPYLVMNGYVPAMRVTGDRQRDLAQAVPFPPHFDLMAWLGDWRELMHRERRRPMRSVIKREARGVVLNRKPKKARDK